MVEAMNVDCKLVEQRPAAARRRWMRLDDTGFVAPTIMEPARPLANFPPSIWGDRFISFSLDNLQLEAYAKAMEEPKEQLRRLIIDPTFEPNKKLSLIYYVYRLGLTYHFKEDIDRQLDKLFEGLNVQDYNEADLYTISVHFQVFRNHGYKLSCDVFNKFIDCDSGAFKDCIVTDVKAMLSFYECAQLRIRGESILDEAYVFTEAQLKSVQKTLGGVLAQQVKYALERPFHRGHPMVEARRYLIHYEEECSVYESLLNLAKVHFNYLQLLQKQELQIVSKWWKDMNFRVITPIVFVLLLDDTYDAYATIEEMRLLTHAINKWDLSAMEKLPEYIKPFYEIILKEYVGLENQLAQQGRENIVDASKHAFQELCRAYLQEAEWRHSGAVPSFKEYMNNGLVTSTHDLLSKSALIGMGKIASKEAVAWYKSHPKILILSESISRLHDDVMTFEFERERADAVTAVDAYMKTFGVSENIAVEEVKGMVENAWKDINEGCLKPTEVPMDLLAPIVNLARMIDVAYKYNDGFTFPEKTFKEYIKLLFIDPITM
ncbi:hypothetical protein L2E82_31238 [Cichorium intybus]|uniref:Uncharacterized protein n=1 Tax=Cichorium intybus TaxID=13427 RepID=A0ACB9D2V1_CICIN|nr:hypothetical protein L2E82_31238 [Cichorium intybus]